MKKVHLWWLGGGVMSISLVVVLILCTVLQVSDGAKPPGPGNSVQATNNNGGGGGQRVGNGNREARNLGRLKNLRNKFPLRAEDPRRKSKRAGGKLFCFELFSFLCNKGIFF